MIRNSLQLIFLSLIVTASLSTYGQMIPLVRKDLGCGPAYAVSKRQDVLGHQLQESPFNGIVHIGKNGGEDWGTGSFISDSVLVTARHVAMGLKTMQLIQYSGSNVRDVVFSKNEFIVIYDRSNRWKINYD